MKRTPPGHFNIKGGLTEGESSDRYNITPFQAGKRGRWGLDGDFSQMGKEWE